MRFGHTSTLSFLSLGVALALAHGCGSTKESTFNPGSGSSAQTGSGTNSTGTNSTGTNSTGTGAVTSSGSGVVTSTTSSTTISTPATGSGSSGAGGSGNFGDAACGSVTQNTKQIPTDIFIMQDKSGSMTCPATDDACTGGMAMMGVQSRWDATTAALNAFVTSPQAGMAGIGVGLGLFPIAGMGNNNASCTAADYATPVVAIAPLPGNAMPIQTAIAGTMLSNGTPTTQALTGAIEYARAYNLAQMGQRTASVVFVTDGNPSGCDNNNNVNTVMAATAAALAGFTGMPSIKTYVIGMGNVASLDSIALAGSGDLTHYIPATGDVATALNNALVSITGMVSCNYTIPAGSDPLLVNLEITLGQGGMPQKVGKVDNAAACGAAGGWFYDVNPPAKPTQITLCPQSCMPLQSTPNSGVQLQLGCPSLPPA